MTYLVTDHENTFDNNSDKMAHGCLSTCCTHSLALKGTSILWCHVEDLCHNQSASFPFRDCLTHRCEVLFGVN